ncbi:FAD-dependent oxidoreductase [Neorhizobium sp. NCHU2750]|uniref:NAD(P)/FAD-dependent oxidoreductase n=1 Tax=Neorhizobium sp. NCHU2750 TaxID=1825976 RepID=UPI000E739921|nr:sarcosine oxidase beta subunit [Neorhizobium sp. NCHU2750]
MTIYDVAIIGGGLAGCSAALHARLMGASVILLERGRCGAQASGVNYGGVRQQGRHPAELALSVRSQKIWESLPDLIGCDCEYKRSGHLKLARDDHDMAELLAYQKVARQYGLNLEIVDADVLRRRFAFLGHHFAGACLCREDGQANPRLVAPAFARRAKLLEAEIFEGAGVVRAAKRNGLFDIQLDGLKDPIRSRRLINTAGAWGSAIAHMFGDRVDEDVMAPNMCVTEPIPPLIGPNIGICGGSIYLRQAANGSVIFGAGLAYANRETQRSRPLAGVTSAAAKQAIKVVPELANALLIRTWTGIEGRMPDGLPIIDISPTTQDLVHAFGFSGHGFQLGPATGAVLAELSLNGGTDTDIAGLSLARFSNSHSQ